MATPILSDFATNNNGMSITATLSESGCTPSNGTGGFTLSGTTTTVGGWIISDTTLTLTLLGTIYQGETVTISYDNATASEAIAHVEDLLEDFAGVSVTNNSTTEVYNPYDTFNPLINYIPLHILKSQHPGLTGRDRGRSHGLGKLAGYR